MNTAAQQVEAYMSGKVELKDVLGMTPEYVQELRGRAQFYLDGGHHERALIMLELLEELDRKDTLPTFLAIDVLLELGRSDAAEAKIEAWLERAPDDHEAWVAKAKLKLATGEWAIAAEILRQVLARDPQGRTRAGQWGRGLANEAYGRMEAAR